MVFFLRKEKSILRWITRSIGLALPCNCGPRRARLVNTIYWCTDDPNRPKSYDDGVPVTIGGGAEGDLLMIPGPLGVRWRDRLLPRLETGELAGYDLATPYRVKRWVDLAPRLEGDSFIKLYTHGAQERNSSALLGGGLKAGVRPLAAEAARNHAAADGLAIC